MRATLSVPLPNIMSVPKVVFIEWILRIGVGMCFIGHGAFGIITKEAWLPYFGLVGIGAEAAYTLMPLVGAMDITLGVIGILSPRRFILLYMTIWTVWTAALRPLTGESIWEFLERAGNFGLPLAFLLAVGLGAGRLWFTRIRTEEFAQLDSPIVMTVLRTTTVLLLLGHGMLAVTGANGIVPTHVASIGLAPELAPVIGGFEVGIAIAAAFTVTPALLVGIGVWKMATEMLFVAAGAPFWEVIERGGSYAAPLVLALILSRRGSAAETTSVPPASSSVERRVR